MGKNVCHLCIAVKALLGHLGAAQDDSLHLHPLQSIHWRTGMESYRGQVTRITLPQQE